MLGEILTNPTIGLHFFNEIFNPMAVFVHILPKIGLNNPAFFRVYQLVLVKGIT